MDGEVVPVRPLTFCDVAMLYCQTGGGIRTYYDAKLDWFARQSTHRYVLIVPSPRSSTNVLSESASVVRVRGIRMTSAPDGYRLFANWHQVRAAIKRCRPDVLESGDPWVSGPLSFGLGRQRPRVVSSFFHADPIATYLEPALRRFTRCGAARIAARVASRAFYRLQASYDVTMVGAAILGDRLRGAGISQVRCAPFGVDPGLFAVARQRPPAEYPTRLLYMGRLDSDKEIELLIEVLPRLLDMPNVSVTVVGQGAYRETFEAWTHPRLRYVGYVRDRAAVAALYRDHDILLAPGAYETFGLAALEALAAGLLVVGPDQGGTGALLKEMSSPFVFEAGRADAFLAAVSGALAADWPRASRAGQAIAARYGTWADAIAGLVATYERLVEVGW